jgi:tetratricopeptide (TPR) repeat protein
LGGVERSQGNFQAAIEFYEQALEWNKDLPDWWMHAQALRGLGVVALAQDRLPEARAFLAESLAVSHQYGYLIWIAEGLAAAAELARKSDEPPRATKLLGASDAIFNKIQGKPPSFVAREIEQTRARVRARLGDAAYEAAWREGKGLEVEQAIKLALGE